MISRENLFISSKNFARWQDVVCKVAGYTMQGGRMQYVRWQDAKIKLDLCKLI